MFVNFKIITAKYLKVRVRLESKRKEAYSRQTFPISDPSVFATSHRTQKFCPVALINSALKRPAVFYRLQSPFTS